MKHLILLCLLSTVSACVAEVPIDGRYSDRDHYDRGHDNGYHRGWDQDRHDDDDDQDNDHGHNHNRH